MTLQQRASAKLSAWYKDFWNYGTFADGATLFGWATITLGICPHSSLKCDKRTLWYINMYNSSAVAEMDDRLVTIDMDRKLGGAAVAPSRPNNIRTGKCTSVSRYIRPCVRPCVRPQKVCPISMKFGMYIVVDK